MIEVTHEMAKRAADTVRGYMNSGEACRGHEWVHITFDLAYTLQYWRRPCLLDPSQNRDDFAEEYDFINKASSYNWHMYEEGDDYI